MNKMPSVLEKLGSMTTIRDTSLLEQSLLKTIGAVLGLSDLSLYSVGAQHECLQVLHQHRHVVVDDTGVERVVERIETVYANIAVPSDVLALMENVRLTQKASFWKSGGTMLAVYPLNNPSGLCGHLVFRITNAISDIEHAVVQGILQVYSNYYALLDESQRDRLTGLYNRHALELNVERMWPLLSPSRGPAPLEGSRRHPVQPQHYWLAILDIDHFKRVNDSYGHIVGDEILLLVSRLIADCFRKSDLVYRYGGEEFLVIASSTSAETAAETFERVRQRIERHIFPQLGRMTVSVGYAAVDPLYSSQEIIGRADRTLYQAKRDGRNRAYSYEALLQSGELQDVNYGSMELF